jgi:hypothetical protein
MKNQNHIDPSTSSGTSPTEREAMIQTPKPVKKFLAGSYLSGLQLPESTPEPVPAPKKRGRKPKYKNDEERRAADAARKRDDRLTGQANEIIAAHPDHLGSHGESSGGHSPQKIEQMDAAQQAAEATGLGTDRDPDRPEAGAPDRRRVSSVPVNPDNDTSERQDETDGTFVGNAMRRQRRTLHAWIHGKKKRVCSQDHAKLAENQKNSRIKVYCAVCRKLLVRPHKAGNFSDKPPEAPK